MKVSIISPCWGHTDLAEQLIKGVATTIGVDFELILVDNGNGVSNNHPKYDWLKVIKAPKNLGFGRGNNLGFTQATGEVICFLNNDIIIDSPTWLTTLLKPFKENNKRLIGHELVEWNDFTQVRGKHHSYINGYCMLMERELFIKAGGFDAGFGLGWFEDVYFAKQAIAFGYELYEQKTAIRHLGSQTIFDGRLDTSKLMVQAGYHFRDRIIKDSIPKGKLRIVFIAHGNYEFSDESWEGKGVGGAESALILLTRELAKLGHLVEVYNNPVTRSRQNGVYYYDIREFRYTDYTDVLIIFRNPFEQLEKVNAKLKLFWSCDQFTIGDYRTNIFPFVDKTICISPFHMKYFQKYYDVKKDFLTYFNLGINLSDYNKAVKKIPGKLIFCSVPHRGLEYLLKIFPEIKRRIPYVSLYITSDYTLWGTTPNNEQYIGKAQEMNGVYYLGKISHQDLVKHQLEADIMAYPCIYDENFCIAAAECIGAGAIPVTSNFGALPTTVGENGVIIERKPGDGVFEDKFVDAIEELLKDREKLNELQQQARDRAKKDFSYEILAKQWEKFLYFELDKKMINLSERLPEKIESLSVLDLGCGIFDSGISMQIPLLPFKSYTGIDIWEEYIKANKKGTYKAGKVEFIQEDILKYLQTAQNKQFDVILLFDVLEHFSKEKARKILKFVEKMCKKRILIFMPIGEHTLEANDGRLATGDPNHYQKHQSEWSVEEWEDLGYDVQLYEGFHQSGKLDAAWILKDTNYMKSCKLCGRTFNSSYYLAKHTVIHGTPDTQDAEKAGIPLAHEVKQPMPNVKIYLTKRIDISTPVIKGQAVNEVQVPYATMADTIRILTEAFGESIIDRHEFLE